MIENFWEATVLFVGVVVALLGASWKLFSNVDNHSTKYRDDAMGLKAILVTNEVQPALINFSSKLEKFRKRHPTQIGKFFENQDSNREIKIILQGTRKVIDIENAIMEIQGKCSDCAFDFIALAATVGSFIILLYFEPVTTCYFVLSTVAIVIILKTVNDFVNYRKRIRSLMTKDNEIRGTW